MKIELEDLFKAKYNRGDIIAVDGHTYLVLYTNCDKMQEDRYAYMLKDIQNGRIVRESFKHVHKYAKWGDAEVAKLAKLLYE